MPSIATTAWTRGQADYPKGRGVRGKKLTNPGCSHCNSLFVSET